MPGLYRRMTFGLKIPLLAFRQSIVEHLLGGTEEYLPWKGSKLVKNSKKETPLHRLNKAWSKRSTCVHCQKLSSQIESGCDICKVPLHKKYFLEYHGISSNWDEN